MPLALLGLNTADREEFTANRAKLVYREYLRLRSDTELDIQSGFLRLLKNAKKVADVPKNHDSFMHVLSGMDAFRRPLQPLYEAWKSPSGAHTILA